MSLVWSREPYSPRRQAMSLERVARAAVAVADAEGLDALSMRRVAAELGSGTTSLYRHIRNRDELLDLMVDVVRDEVPALSLSGDWRADLAAHAHAQRALMLRHPWLGTLLMIRPALGPNSLRQMNEALAAAAQLTPDATRVAGVIGLIGDYVLGAVSRELAELEAHRRTGQSEQEWRASVGPYISEVIASGDYPHFARRVMEARDLTFTEQFAYGLERILDGIGGG
ncbi:TetR family transcriptional regulator [Planotetraspora thailandica]|uniref:TetR family transcriptional regulator n=1 Tax=Planotetraspora thailandica TaxID=487172 RepID=A0A8J3VA03_9ACTN|nr:TetR/AcrR family transcriptional regulator C-terminal domain-containing protein [Planotetraspora thailandica]GII57721.1 TetR family transcriptional regulator [Planotetraspora thailandica]